MHCNYKNRDHFIDGYFEGSLTPAERDAFDEHCFVCDQCHHELLLRDNLIRVIRQDGPSVFAPYLKRWAQPGLFMSLGRLFKRYWTWKSRWAIATAALATVFLLSLVIFTFNWLPSEMREREILTDAGTTPRPDSVIQALQRDVQMPGRSSSSEAAEPEKSGRPRERLLADARSFEPTPYLEEMVESVLRSATASAIRPANGDTVRQPVHFSWSTSMPAVLVVILDRQGTVIVRLKPERQSIAYSGTLAPGLYYWKLESEEDLLHIGKFYIRPR